MSTHEPDDRPAPTRLGRYEVRAKIGEGGMATVYVGRAPDGRTVALKVIRAELSASPEFVNMFIDEARIAAKLSDPNVVQIQELGEHEGRLFIAMELLTGQSLWDVWQACRARGVRMRPEVVAWMGARIASGLHHAHEMRDASGAHQGIVHRDVNASNVFVTYDGELKIIDFGLAKAANRVSKTAAGIVKGKLAYLSPEQAAGNAIDRRADVFALGTTLWELSVDRRLFRQKDDIETLRRIVAAKVPEPPSIIPGFPAAFWTILQKALARDPRDRYATAEAMAKDLDAFAASGPQPADARSIALLMAELFAGEKERQRSFFTQASKAVPIPLTTLRPPSKHESVLPQAPVAASLSPAVVVPSTGRVPAFAAPDTTAVVAEEEHARGGGRTLLVVLLVATAVVLVVLIAVFGRG